MFYVYSTYSVKLISFESASRGYLFIYSLFSDAVSSSDYTASSSEINNGWKRCGRRLSLTTLRQYLDIFQEGLKEHENASRKNLSLDRDLNQETNEGVLNCCPQCPAGSRSCACVCVCECTYVSMYACRPIYVHMFSVTVKGWYRTTRPMWCNHF
jgi:hypothetical protein